MMLVVYPPTTTVGREVFHPVLAVLVFSKKKNIFFLGEGGGLNLRN